MRQVNNININETIVIDGDDDDNNDAITMDNTISTFPLLKNPYAVSRPPSRRNDLEVMVSNNFSHVKKKLKVTNRAQNDTIIVLTDDDYDDYGDDDINNNAQLQSDIINTPDKSFVPIENTQTSVNTKKRTRKQKSLLTKSFMSFDNEQVPDGKKKKSPKQQKASKKNDKKIETLDDEIEVVWNSNSTTDTYQAQSNDDLFWYDSVGNSSNLEVLESWDVPITKNYSRNDPTPSNLNYLNYLNKSSEAPVKKTCNNKASTRQVNTDNTSISLNYINGYAVPTVEYTHQNKTQRSNPTSTSVSIYNFNGYPTAAVNRSRKNKAIVADSTSTSVSLNNLNDIAKSPVKKTRKNKVKTLKGKKRVKRKRQVSETYVYDSSDEIDESKQNENENLNTEKLVNDNNQTTKKQNLNNEKLRTIVVDGSNVAMAHSNGKHFSIKGIELIIEYFRSRGHKVKVFLSQKRNKGKDRKLLDKWREEDIVVLTPSRMVDNKRITPYDDRYILEYATKVDGIVVSSDQFRDLYEEKPEWRKTIKTNILPPTFVDDYVMFPQDPLGCKGPSLDKFLRH